MKLPLLHGEPIELPESMCHANVEYRLFSSEVLHVFGWVVRLGRIPTEKERCWLEKNGFLEMDQGWYRKDQSPPE